jgi:hypothetical protein
MEIITVLLIAAVLVLLSLNVFLLWKLHVTDKKINTLLENGKVKSFKDIILSQNEKNGDMAKQIKEAFSRIKDLDGICQTTIRKTGVVRFNPFNNMGGNQSFVIALLDGKNNGFVISSLFIKEGNRVYTKAIKKGKSEHALSREETEAIKMAINQEKE